MRKISGILIVVVMIALGLSVASAETKTYTYDVQRLEDTPTKYGPKGYYTLFSQDTYQKGKYGIGFFWDMTRFALPGDPRYPEVMEFTLSGAYGITDNWEISAAIPFRNVNIPAASAENRDPNDIALNDVSESGLSNMSLALRWKFWQGQTAAVSAYLQSFLPTASDPKKGTGADNTRFLFGLNFGQDFDRIRYTLHAAYQLGTGYDQDAQNFSEVDPNYPRPRFERFGTNPLFHEYGSTLFYSAGVAFPLRKDRFELFSELNFYHSFEDKDYIPMFKDAQPLDVVQDGGMANIGVKAGFGNGWAVSGGWGGILFAEEPMYESPTWKLFAGVTYNKPHTVTEVREISDVPDVVGPGVIAPPLPEIPVDEVRPPIIGFDCRKELLMVHFEFDKSTLTPEGIEALQRIGKYMRLCTQSVLEVQGHTDWMGTENYNIGLGNRRARAVVYYLVYDEGIDPARIVSPEKLAKGIIAGETYGESVPIASNETDSGRALNRRGQFVKLVADNRMLGQ